MAENQRVIRAFPTTERRKATGAIAEEVRLIAAAVSAIGRGRRSTPESILIEKYDAADRLLALASRMERGG